MNDSQSLDTLSGMAVFSTRSYAPLAAEIARLGTSQAWEIERQAFADGMQWSWRFVDQLKRRSLLFEEQLI